MWSTASAEDSAPDVRILTKSTLVNREAEIILLTQEHKAMGHIIKVFFKGLLLLVACALVMLFLLFLVYLIPAESMEEHIVASTDLLLEEGAYPVLHEHRPRNLDNYTDGLMLNIASFDGDKPLLDRVLYNYRYTATIDGEKVSSPYDFIYHALRYTELKYKVSSYMRYWHGYLLFLKPLLFFFSYPAIRTINTVAQSILALLLVFLLWKKGPKQLILPFFLVWLILDPMVTGSCLQFSGNYYVFSVGCILLLWKYEALQQKRLFPYFFILLGAATSTCDLLSYPLVTLGIPMVVFMAKKEPAGIREDLLQIIGYSAAWCFGYAGLWACKWIISSVLTDANSIQNAINTVLYRAGGTEKGHVISFYEILSRVLQYTFKDPLAYVVLAVAGCLFVYCLCSRRFQVHDVIIFSFLALFPFVWYFTIRNHTYVHFWFAWRSITVSFFSILSMVFLPLKKRERQNVE